MENLPLNEDFERLLRPKPIVLVFLSNTNELQRFVFSGAFDELAQDHQLHYVLPPEESHKMRIAAPGTLTTDNSSELQIPSERFTKWAELFQSACFHYANLSPSFAIRANLALNASRWWMLKVIPVVLWKPFFLLINYCQQYLSWPNALGRRLKGLELILSEALKNPDQFSMVRDRVYEHYVEDVLQSMAPYQGIVELFDRFKPLYCLVPTSLLDLFCNDVVWACESEQVGCVILQSGWDNLSSKGILCKKTPFLGCWGPQSASHARSIQGLDRSMICNLGAPHYEFLKPVPPNDVKKMRLTLGVRENERLILFGGSFRQFDETGTLRSLENAIAEGRLGSVKIVYRPHPWRATRQFEDNFFNYEWRHVVFDPDMQSRYLQEQAETGYIKRNVPMFDMAYLAQLLSAVDAVVSPMSTLLVESLIMEKPTMAIAFGDGKHKHDPSVTSRMTHFAELKSSKALNWCDNSARLIDDCIDLLKTASGDQILQERRGLISQIVIREPGTYAERLAEFCRATVEPLARNLRGRRADSKRGTISHAYGANEIARDYCGIQIVNPIVPGYWMHGWIPAYHNIHPALIALHKKQGQHNGYDYGAQIQGEKIEQPQWVSRVDQADYLLAHGYKHVKAIGLPIVYMPDCTIRRVPGSLLVMPPHSHKNHGPDDPLAENYAAVIADLKKKFEHIWVGLNEDDFAKKQWVESFRRKKINVFITTDQSDPFTLHRLKRILSSFEYMTTNGFGSHIALAAYCGTKVSVYGPFAEFPLHRMKATHAVKMFPGLLEQAYYLCTEYALKKQYPFLFVEPDKAGLLREWGAEEVGEPCRLSPQDLARLFKWISRPMETESAESHSAII